MCLLSGKFTVPLQLLIMATWTSADSALVSHDALLLKMCILIFFLLIPPGLGDQLGTLKHELRKFWPCSYICGLGADPSGVYTHVLKQVPIFTASWIHMFKD